MNNKQNRTVAVAAAFVVSLLQLTAPAWAQSWTTIAPLPTPRIGLMAAGVGTHVYAIGGNEPGFCNTTARVDAFNTVTGTWSARAPMLTPRLQGVAVPVAGKIYVIGGQAFCSSYIAGAVEVYDPATDTWTPRTPLPVDRRMHAAAAHDGKIYVMGGWGDSGLEATLFIYDTVADSWTAGASMPYPRVGFGAATLDGLIYAIGNVYGADSLVIAYDPATNSWSPRPGALPENPFTNAVVLADGAIHTLGGRREFPAALLSRMDRYDASTGTWIAMPSMLTPRESHAAAAIGGSIYAMGGLNGTVLLAAAEVYNAPPAPPADTTPPQIVASATPSANPAGWNNTNVNVALSATDNVGGSGVASVTYALTGASSGGATVAGAAASPALTAEGVSTLTYRATDVAGNASANQALVLRVDKTVPQSSASATPAANAAGWNNTNVNVALSATDNAGGSGVASVTYALTGASSGGATVPGAAASTGVSAEGASTVTYRAADVAGNSSVDQTILVRLDKTAPQASASATPAANAAGWNNTNVNIALSATDNAGGSGVASVTYALTGASSGGATVPGSTASFDVTAEGVSTVSYRASDAAGNDSASHTVVVRIDRTGPSGSLAVSPNVLWPPNNKMVPIVVSLSTSDASGPVSVSGPVVTSNETPSVAGDWEVSGTTLRLRASRNGEGGGRVYTIAYTLTDAAGNTRVISAIVTVPHDPGR